jgi:hypothetical protein
MFDFPTLLCTRSNKDISFLVLVFLHNVASDVRLVFFAHNFPGSGQNIVLFALLLFIVLLVMFLLQLLCFYPLAMPMHL